MEVKLYILAINTIADNPKIMVFTDIEDAIKEASRYRIGSSYIEPTVPNYILYLKYLDRDCDDCDGFSVTTVTVEEKVISSEPLHNIVSTDVFINEHAQLKELVDVLQKESDSWFGEYKQVVRQLRKERQAHRDTKEKLNELQNKLAP